MFSGALEFFYVRHLKFVSIAVRMVKLRVALLLRSLDSSTGISLEVFLYGLLAEGE